MKKRILTKVITMAMACALVVGNTGIVAHATEYDDGCVRDDVAGGGGGSASLDDGGSGSSSDSGSSSSNSGSGSSNSGSDYNDGYVRDDVAAGGGGNASLSDGGSSSTASYTAPKAAGKAVSAGKETFRAVAKAGIEIATFSLMDTDKKAVSCTAVALKQREDGKWAVNYDVADATGLTVGAPLDRTYMYNTLGVSYITINDTVIIDIEAEAAAK